MKNEKPKLDEKELTDSIDEQVADKSVLLKKKKTVDVIPAEVPKIKKTKTEKDNKATVEPNEQKTQKTQKEDKLTKFLVSMKKSVRKNIKKEAAEVGVSMNEYIVLAVEEKLSQVSFKK